MRPQARIIYSIERFENRIRLVIIDYWLENISIAYFIDSCRLFHAEVAT